MESKTISGSKRRSNSSQQQKQQLLDPFDMNGPDFNPDLFLNKVLKEQNLSNLLESEVSLYKSIGSLDSEMQTLVYENYNKFISATDTITKMSRNFDEIEGELDKLSGKIAQITSSSSEISESLREKRTNLSKLSSTFVLLQKLDFLFQLPVKMSGFYNDKRYVEAVKCYLQSESTLKHYQHFPSISIIDQECQSLLVKLKEKLHESFTSFDSDPQHLDVPGHSTGTVSPVSSGQKSPLLLEDSLENKSSNSIQPAENSITTIIGLLLQLNENPDFLSFRFLKYSCKRLDSKLSQLDYYISMNEKLIRKKKKVVAKNEIGKKDVVKDEIEKEDVAKNEIEKKDLAKDEIEEKDEIMEAIEDEMIPVDVLEFVDMACNGLLSQLVSIIHSFDHLFMSKTSDGNHSTSTSETEKKTRVSSDSELMKFVDKYMNGFMDRITSRLSQESVNETDFKFLSRSLDRFHRRVISVRKVLPNQDYTKRSNQVIEKVINSLMIGFKTNLEATFNEQIMKMRQLIVAGCIKDSVKTLISEFESLIFDSVHSVIKSITMFLDPGIQFSKEGVFESTFLMKIREDIVISFLDYMIKTLDTYSSTTKSNTSSSSVLVLILSKVCLNLDQNLVGKIVSLIDDDPKLAPKLVPPKNLRQGIHVTEVSVMKKAANEAGHKLLVHYVILEGHNLSQMIRKSVETRDWLSSIEPRSVRPVMKRMMEDVVSVESIVSQLYEEGFAPKTASSTGSSSRGRFSSIKKGQCGGMKKMTTSSSGHHLLSHGNPYTSTTPHLPSHSLNHSFDMINISKFLSEKIDLNLNKLQTDKVSIMTAIIKIMLKSLIEVIRFSTFARFGLQQIQVDCFYLQMFCWKYVSDETIVYNLLEDAIQSAINRSLHPLLMEMSIVESICEAVN